MKTVDEWKATLRRALTAAMRERRGDAVAVLREVLSALDQAEAVDTSLAPASEPGPIAGAVRGLGAAEVPRRRLEPADVEALIAREVADRESARASLLALGQSEAAARLEAQLAVLASLRSA